MTEYPEGDSDTKQSGKKGETDYRRSTQTDYWAF